MRTSRPRMATLMGLVVGTIGIAILATRANYRRPRQAEQALGPAHQRNGRSK